MYNSFIYLLNTYCKWSSQSILKEINPEYSLAGRTDAEAEASVLWPPDVKSWLIRNNPDAGKDWRQEEKGTTEDEMVGWHHQPNGHEFEQALGDGEGEGRLACCSPWGCKESDMTEQLNNNKTSGWFCWCHILLNLFFKNIFILPLFSKIIFAQYRI